MCDRLFLANPIPCPFLRRKYFLAFAWNPVRRLNDAQTGYQTAHPKLYKKEVLSQSIPYLKCIADKALHNSWQAVLPRKFQAMLFFYHFFFFLIIQCPVDSF